VPTLIIIGADTPGALPGMSRALAAYVRRSRVEVIPNARHFMFEDDPVRYCAAVLAFLAG
jgi:esterase